VRSEASYATEDALVAQARYYAARARHKRVGRQRPSKEARADVESHRQASQMAFGQVARLGGMPPKGTRDQLAAAEVARLRIKNDLRHKRCQCGCGRRLAEP
jgi:hypothetical protein